MSQNLLFAQQLDAIGKKDPIKVTGGINTNQIAYIGPGLNTRRAPYTVFANANLNLNIYGYAMPFSISISNQAKGRFQQPFNQYKLDPSYKWITAHLGYTSMSFSSYTLNGHLFSGLGLDLSPKGAFKFNVMYGDLNKAVIVDPTLGNTNIQPSYQRKGYGFKAAYSKDKDFVNVVVFKAKDIVSSNTTIPKNGLILPQDNLVSSMSFAKLLFKKFLVNTEVALSALTRDQNAITDSLTEQSKESAFFIVNNSTAFYTAYKTSIAYGAKKSTIALGYERIAPEYKTLGAYYFNNDFENITANLTTKIFKDKLAVVVGGGLQRDNLRNDKQSSAKRMVSSANLSYQHSQKLNFTGSYSNFQSFVNIRSSFNAVNSLTPYDNLDTLNYTQISQNINLNATYFIKQERDLVKVLNVNFSMVTSADKQGGINQNSGGNFYNLNTLYNISFVPKKLTLNTSLNLSANKFGPIQSITVGPTLGLTKSFFEKKLNSGLSFTWNSNYANGQENNRILNFRINNSYAVKKKHQINLSLVGLASKTNGISSMPGLIATQEFTATLGYNYNF